MPRFVSDEFDARVRASGLAYLRTVMLRTGGPVSFKDVRDFEIDGQRIPLMAPQQGIRKPRQLNAALSFRTAYRADPSRRPYEDAEARDGYFRYKWRGTDPDTYTNVAMRLAMNADLPLIWFIGVAKNQYLPIAPVWLVGEEREQEQFVVALDGHQRELWNEALDARVTELNREYVDRLRRERVHQPVFRTQVLLAYEGRCALCRLGHRVLLDAAHIRPDSKGGEPIVPNGISMCKIHHAAYDNRIMGIRPDYQIEVRPDILDERDGPTLRHAVQGLHEERILLPSRRVLRPDRDLLNERYTEFLSAT